MGRRIFITGATGLIGSHVAEQLRARGDGVVALVRESSDTAFLRSIGCELVVGDVLDPPEVTAEAMAGSDAVVHAAAVVFQAATRATYLRINVKGTERVLGAAGQAAPRVVHVSSVAVYSGLDWDRPLTEDRWTEADPERQSAYAASKHLSERAAWRLHESGVIRLTTVRPSVVYGERDRAAGPVIERYLSLPVVPLLGGGRTALPLVYAGNVAAGILAALDRPETEGRAYNLAHDTPISLRDLVRLTGEVRGRRVRRLSVPATPVRWGAAAVEAVGRLVPGVRTGEARRAVRSLITDNPYDSSRARQELGWSGLVPHEQGVRRTFG